MTEKLTHNQSLVLARLIEAAETDRMMAMRIGPKSFGNAMPAFSMSKVEIWLAEFDAEHFKRINVDKNAEVERSAKTQRERIGRMEEANQWVRDFIDLTDDRKLLWNFVIAMSLSTTWSKAIRRLNELKKARAKETEIRKRSVERRLARQIKQLLEIVAEKLAKSGIVLQDEGSFRLSQIGPESTGKSIRSKLRAFREEQWKPDLSQMNSPDTARQR
jgi:hypothetical protein